VGTTEVSSLECVFVVQVHATIPDAAWEYHIRKSLNDAAYKGLDYVPYNTTMPLTPQSDNVKFIWVSQDLPCSAGLLIMKHMLGCSAVTPTV
jgi:hypothetical protein